MTVSPPPLRAGALTRAFAGERAVDRLDLEVERGQIHAIVGLNGAGKTTLMRLLLGMLVPDAGRATVMGCDATEAPPEVWKQVGHLIEAPLAYPELTVAENLAAAADLHMLDGSQIPALVEESVEAFGLEPWAAKRARTLSSGNRQRLGLAAATVHRPAILILDEPANALDPAGVVFIRDMLQEYAAEGAAILVSSHHLDEVARISDRITVMHRGRTVGNLDPTDLDLERRFFDLVYRADLSRPGDAA